MCLRDLLNLLREQDVAISEPKLRCPGAGSWSRRRQRVGRVGL
jgi:hypothetical protein